MQELSRTRIKIKAAGLGEADGELIRFLAPRTVESIVRILPIEGKAALWKEEAYFSIPVQVGAEKQTSVVEAGTLAYWPQGTAFCIFYGKSQPYGPVNRIGKITHNIEMFKSVRDGMIIRVEKA
ncbi:MAG: cyclophilin-like fold protein [Candidatus Bathyarchaeia archaeon]